MRDFQAKRKLKRVLFAWPAIVVLVLLNLLLVRANLELYGKERYAAKNEAQAEKEYNDVAGRENSLTADVSRLSSPEGVDLELRRKFQVVQPGEETVVIVASSSTTPEPKLEQKPGMWENLMHWFGF